MEHISKAVERPIDESLAIAREAGALGLMAHAGSGHHPAQRSQENPLRADECVAPRPRPSRYTTLRAGAVDRALESPETDLSNPAPSRVRPIGKIPFRWWIAALLFASTTINYIDRQTLSVLAPYLKRDFGWSNSDFALIIVAFRAAYTIFQVVAGRLLDRLGTKRGLSLAVLWYSLVAMATSAAAGIKSFALFRFLLGAGEAANWPGATKAVSEWFPESERGLAVAIFDSGSAVGGAVAPVMVVWLYHSFGNWRPAFVFTGLLGLLWFVLWRLAYRTPDLLPVSARDVDAGQGNYSWQSLLRRKETWGILLGKALTDPVWFFITDWFAIYLVSKGFTLENTLLGFWIPFLAADLGNFAGGGLSSYCIRRGWPVLKARKLVVLLGGIGMTMLIPAAFLSDFVVLVALFAISTFSYAAWSTMGLTFPADLFPSKAVATVSGMSGAAAGLGTITSTLLIGRVTDRYSFAPVLIGASLLPVIATVLVFVLIRDRKPAAGGPS